MRREPAVKPKHEGLFFFLVRNLFMKRRKQIQKTLRSEKELLIGKEEIGAIEEKSGIDLRKRPEELSMEEFASLSDAVLLCLPDSEVFHRIDTDRRVGKTELNGTE